MGNNYTRILMHFGINMEKIKLQEIHNQDIKNVKKTFKYSNLIKLFGGTLYGLKNIDDYIEIRIKALKRLQRANQNFKNRLLKQIKKQNEGYNGK